MLQKEGQKKFERENNQRRCTETPQYDQAVAQYKTKETSILWSQKAKKRHQDHLYGGKHRRQKSERQNTTDLDQQYGTVACKDAKICIADAAAVECH